MQNNITDLSQKLQRSLDNNYNVIDMPAVVEVISTLEKTTVTKELLETTRLGKYINELRRRTTNESLAKRAKDLVKKWRVLILPEANGQIKQTPAIQPTNEIVNSPTIQDVKNRKRPLKDKTDVNAKKPILNGQRDYEFSDNSNCSVKDLKKTDVIFINSDSNSSMPDQTNDSFISLKNTPIKKEATPPKEVIEELPPQPKKRGRKKGSKNHKHLIVAAEESFSNKMSAISRNSKVKTTQELLADLQNRSKPDIELRAAQLTESLSRIDQKLNPQKNINQNVIPIKNEKVLIKSENKIVNSVKSELENNENRFFKQELFDHSSRVSTPDVVIVPSDDEIVDVVGTEGVKEEDFKKENMPESLSVEEILAKLPPIDREALDEPDEFPPCNCEVPEPENVNNITVQIINEDQKEPYSIFESSPKHSSPKSDDDDNDDVKETTIKKCDSDPLKDFVEDLNCPTRLYIRDKYNLDSVSVETVENLKNKCIENVNGNYGLKTEMSDYALCENGLYLNIVPKYESLNNDLKCVPNESFNKYSISFDSDKDNRGICDSEIPPRNENLSEFCQWHQTLDVKSYNGESLRILPYVIID